MGKYRNYIINLLLPAFVFGSVTGFITAVIVSFYKLCAKFVISMSEKGYHLLNERLYLIPALIVAFFGIALLFSYIYKKN